LLYEFGEAQMKCKRWYMSSWWAF